MSHSMGLNYQKVVELAKARDLVNQYSWIYAHKEKDRTYRTGQVLYSPQEILIESRRSWSTQQYQHRHLPAGVIRHWFGTPYKEYMSFKDQTGTDRYYLVPSQGLRLRATQGGTYKAVNPIKDYSIAVDRAAAKKAREDGEEFIHYLNTIWNMVMCPANPNERPRTAADFDNLPDYENKDAWFQFLLAAKYPYWSGMSLALSTVTQKIRNRFTQDALAYTVTPVPDTRKDHTAHWGMLDKLRAAGRLEKYEGKAKAVKSRRPVRSGH